MSSQTTDTVLMVRPSNFGFNPQTAESNAFQKTLEGVNTQSLAVTEFENMVRDLREAGINVIVCTDNPEPPRPDAIFPNNWISTHPDGTVVLYPMYAPNRRLEVRHDILEYLEGTMGYEIRQVLDYTAEAEKGRYLEGTGSLVLDRRHKVAYACLSPRTDKALLDEWAQKLGYTVCSFYAKDRTGADIYHTNVMMNVGHTFAVVCLDSITDATERDRVVRTLQKNGQEIIDITLDQMYDMVGNMLLLRNSHGIYKLVLSQRAFSCLTADQKAKLLNHCELLPVDIQHIEIEGGGSARCMIAEVFLPRH